MPLPREGGSLPHARKPSPAARPDGPAGTLRRWRASGLVLLAALLLAPAAEAQEGCEAPLGRRCVRIAAGQAVVPPAALALAAPTPEPPPPAGPAVRPGPEAAAEGPDAADAPPAPRDEIDLQRVLRLLFGTVLSMAGLGLFVPLLRALALLLLVVPATLLRGALGALVPK